MSRLNAKTAKMLRKAAGYKNQTATPAAPPFPGIHHLMDFPLFKKRPKTRGTEPNGEPLMTMQGHMVGNRRFIAVPALEKYEVTDEAGVVHKGTRQATQPVPVTKPAKHNDSTTKGAYRALKTMQKEFGRLPTVTVASDQMTFDELTAIDYGQVEARAIAGMIAEDESNAS